MLFVTCVCIALMAMNAWLIIRAHASEIQQVNRANSNLARSVSQQIEATIALPDGVLLMLFFSGSFLTWRAAFWTDTRSSRIVRWVAPALPLALMAAGAFLSSTTVVG